VAGHGQNRLGIAYPYVAGQMRGAYLDAAGPDDPSSMIGCNPVSDRRRRAQLRHHAGGFSDAIDDERRRLNADAAARVDLRLTSFLRRMAVLATKWAPARRRTISSWTTLDSLLAGPEDPQRRGTRRPGGPYRKLVATGILPAYERFVND